MASFLDNTGDIVLDAVLTDYGRQLLAKGDGSFNIVKFAFGDDEIDYSLWNPAVTSPNQDTDIMKTPILEAFTNNAASLKSKLLTINIENLLFLPVIKLNNINGINQTGSFPSAVSPIFTGFVIPVDTNSNTKETTTALKEGGATLKVGVLGQQNKIKVDQGLDNSSTDPFKSLTDVNPELYEREYNIYLDYRIARVDGITSPISVDDDGMGVYRVTSDNTNFVIPAVTDSTSSPIRGSKGSSLELRILPQTVLETTDTYFNNLGDKDIVLTSVSTDKFKTIRTYVKIVGVTTGYSIEIPILFVKKQ